MKKGFGDLKLVRIEKDWQLVLKTSSPGEELKFPLPGTARFPLETETLFRVVNHGENPKILVSGYPCGYSILKVREGLSYLVEYAAAAGNHVVIRVWLLPEEALLLFGPSSQFVRVLSPKESVIFILDGKRVV